nr:retrovirus-related Pol polyprotein from transposon TNT 1-94 [Tanacetum cinerariifolium]
STIYKNAKLRTQLFKKVSEQKDNTHDTSENTKFAKQPIVENLPKVGETNALSKPVTSNSVSTPQESKGVNNDKVIAPGMFRINPFKTFRVEKHVPNSVRASDKKKPIIVSQPPVITKNDVNSDVNGLSSIGVENTKTRRPQPRSNTKHDRVPSASKSSRSKNKEDEVEDHYRNLLLSKNNKHISSACNNIKIDSQDVISIVVCAMCKKCLISVNHYKCLRNYVNDKNSRGNLKLLINFVWKFMGTVRFKNDHVAAILGFGDLQWGNILITRVYFVEGLGHNLFSVGKFYDSNLEVAFRRNACFVRNLEGVDLLKGDRSTNLYTINLHEMASASPIYLMARASSTKSWLWHQRLSHLNFDTINDLAKNDLVSGLPKFKYHKEHLCPSYIVKLGAKGDIGVFIRYSADSCAYRIYNRRTKKIMETMNVSFNELSAMAFEQRSSKPGLQSMTSGQIILGLDLTYALSTITTQQPSEVIVDDYSRFTWVKFLRSKDETAMFIIKFLKMIQVRLNVSVRRIRTDNGTEFVNQTLRDYYEEVGISHETSVARSPQQNGAEAVATACFTQNRSIFRLRHGKTPYELLHSKLPDLSFFHVFGALCYPTNDNENLAKLQPKADIGIFIGYAPSGLVHKSSSLASYVPPSRNDWDLLFQPMFDELLNPPPSVDNQAAKVIAPIADVTPLFVKKTLGHNHGVSSKHSKENIKSETSGKVGKTPRLPL